MTDKLVKLFWQKLNVVFPKKLSEEETIVIKFNILLVKFGARYSTLPEVNYQKFLTPEFVEFITNDSDLVMNWFKTESQNLSLWIYNKKFNKLFIHNDISMYDNETIAFVRGVRLGMFCPDYFLKALDETSFLIKYTINNFTFFAYVCPLSDITQHSQEALKTYLQFHKFANILDLQLTLILDDRYMM